MPILHKFNFMVKKNCHLRVFTRKAFYNEEITAEFHNQRAYRHFALIYYLFGFLHVIYILGSGIYCWKNRYVFQQDKNSVDILTLLEKT